MYMLSLSEHHRKDSLTTSPLINWSCIAVYTVSVIIRVI